jgi:serine/threonine protein kinase
MSRTAIQSPLADSLGIIACPLIALAVMHGVGIAHLDVKPSNTIVRQADGAAVLVDFGLSGRKLRAGCATLCYGAPEIWQGAETPTETSAALAADVYAFGCLAYEVMTGGTLFDGASDVAIIAGHIQHDGLPPAVGALAGQAPLEPFAMFLHQCLRHDPSQRANVGQLRKELSQLRDSLAPLTWPLTSTPP